MKNIKHSIMIPLLGRIADRFHEYQPPRSLEERLEMVTRIPGAAGIEVVTPGDFIPDFDKALELIKKSGLAISAVNLNVKSEKKWQDGSFTARDPQIRKDAVAALKGAMDLAAELGTDLVSCCPLIDGHNYSFEADYVKQWEWLKEGLAEGAQHRSDIKISLEYKLNESRNFVILSDMGRSLYLCEQLGLPNIGVTMDTGHAFLAKETPAEAAALALQANRLFYVHFNDNAREWDWDMLPGSVNLWDLVEVLFYLQRAGWQGWFCYDILTRNGDLVESMSATLSMMETCEALLDKIGRDKIQEFIDEGIPARAFDYMMKKLL